jgi:hypothetical protein
VPRNAVLSVGYLWGRVQDAELWDFCGARGKPRWLSQLGVQRLGASFRGGLAAKTSGQAVAPEGGDLDSHGIRPPRDSNRE